MLLTEKKELLHYTNRSFTFLRSSHLAEGSAFPEGDCVERQEAEHSVNAGGALLCVLHFPSGHSHTSIIYCSGGGNVDLHTGTKYFLLKWTSMSLGFLPAPLAWGITHSRLKCKGHVKTKLGKKLPSLIPSLDTSSPPGNNTTGYSNKPERGNSNVSSYMKVKPYTHINRSLPVESVSIYKNESLCIDAYQKNNILGCHKKQLQITFFICPILKILLNLDRETE